MERKILSVSYDESLLVTRQLILQQDGYQVTSALGFIEALRRCKEGGFDLAIVGHSIPRSDKRVLLEEIHKSCRAPVLSLYKSSEGSLPGADYAMDAMDGPQALLEMVHKVLDSSAATR
jgi:DNA-binding response OmpR family regulator